jgi:hypothetical protein
VGQLAFRARLPPVSHDSKPQRLTMKRLKALYNRFFMSTPLLPGIVFPSRAHELEELDMFELACRSVPYEPTLLHVTSLEVHKYLKREGRAEHESVVARIVLEPPQGVQREKRPKTSSVKHYLRAERFRDGMCLLYNNLRALTCPPYQGEPKPNEAKSSGTEVLDNEASPLKPESIIPSPNATVDTTTSLPIQSQTPGRGTRSGGAEASQSGKRLISFIILLASVRNSIKMTTVVSRSSSPSLRDCPARDVIKTYPLDHVDDELDKTTCVHEVTFEGREFSVLELATLLQAATTSYPTYSLFDTQCYFYASIVVGAAAQIFRGKVMPKQPNSRSQGTWIAYHVNARDSIDKAITTVRLKYESLKGDREPSTFEIKRRHAEEVAERDRLAAERERHYTDQAADRERRHAEEMREMRARLEARKSTEGSV